MRYAPAFLVELRFASQRFELLNLELLNRLHGEHKAKNNVCFLFATVLFSLLQVFNRCP